MKTYLFEGSIKKINSMLKRIGLECFCQDYLIIGGKEVYLPFDYDGMQTDTEGVSVQIERTLDDAFECFVCKYNLADLAKLEKELGY